MVLCLCKWQEGSGIFGPRVMEIARVIMLRDGGC